MKKMPTWKWAGFDSEEEFDAFCERLDKEIAEGRDWSIRISPVSTVREADEPS